MKKSLGVWLCLPFSLALAGEVVELRDVRVVDHQSDQARQVERLWIDDGQIVAIDDQGQPPQQEQATSWLTLDLKGAYLMPGLIETHVHVARFPDTRNKAERILRGALRWGVTGVRDLAGDARALTDLQRAAAVDGLLLPELQFSAVLAGPAVFSRGPLAEMAQGFPAGQAAWTRSIEPTTDIRLAIAEARGSGAGNIKLYGNLDAAQVKALTAEAHRQGLKVTAHGTVFPARPSDLVAAGVDSLAHVPYLVWQAADQVPADFGQRSAGAWDTVAPDHPAIRALFRQMAKSEVSLDATLWVFKAMNNFSPDHQVPWADQAFQWGAAAVRVAREEGVSVTTGTDWFEPRNEWEPPNTAEEVVLLVEAAGFSPREAIAAATFNGAKALGWGDRLGSIEVGKQADLLLLAENPLQDIQNIRSVQRVFRRGRLVQP